MSTTNWTGKNAQIVLIAVLSSLLFSTSAVFAQDKGNYNKEVRTNTWSIYTQGGLSWATDVWYENIDAKTSYKLAPAVGGGIDFNIHPWIRVGAEYMYSRYRREQRFSVLDPNAVPLKTYGNYLMNFHNAKVGAGFNIMEIWPNRGCQWLNIYAGTGVGYMFAKGNEYGIYFSTTMIKDGVTTPVTGSVIIDNSSSITFSGKVETTNTHSQFNRLYIPASLHIEADLSKQVAIGIKGESDWLLNRKEIAPKSLIFALATMRYTFGNPKIAAKRKRADIERSQEIDALIYSMRDSLQKAEERLDIAYAATVECQKLREENDALRKSLEECEDCQSIKNISHVVYFANGSAEISESEEADLRAFAKSVRGQRLSLVAEASTPGSKDQNQKLSEMRLQSVVRMLDDEGIGLRDIYPGIAIGSQMGNETAEGRKVTITVE